MTNSEKFKDVFGLYATELWAMPEKDLLNWINTEYKESESVQPENEFLNFLWNVINPNEMEHYLSMYHSGGGKTDE